MRYIADFDVSFQACIQGFKLEAPLNISYLKDEDGDIEVNHLDISYIYLENEDGDQSFNVDDALPPRIKEEFNEAAEAYAEREKDSPRLTWEEYEE